MSVEFLSFVTRLLETESIHYTILSDPFDNLRETDRRFRSVFMDGKGYVRFLSFLQAHCPDRTVLQLKDCFEANYTVMKLPTPDGKLSYLVIGPTLSHRFSDEEVESLCLALSIPPIFRRNLQEFLYTIPVIECTELYRMLMKIAAYGLFETDQFAMEEATVDEELPPVEENTSKAKKSAPDDNSLARSMEESTRQENRLLSTIARGDEKEAKELVEALARTLPDSEGPYLTRETKNRAIAFNALLRKTLEKEEVHPFYAGSHAKAFEHRIEQADTFGNLCELLNELVVCLVKRNWIKW